MKLFKVISSVIVLMAMPFTANSAEAEVKFTEPEKFVDIKPSRHDNRAKFIDDVTFNVRRHFEKLAAELPEGQKLKIEVTDIDLAGDTRIGGVNEMRIIKSMYPPRINFTYQLLDEKSQQIVDGQINLKDMNFMSKSLVRYKNDFIAYEKRMLDTWFKKTFKEYIVKK